MADVLTKAALFPSSSSGDSLPKINTSALAVPSKASNPRGFPSTSLGCEFLRMNVSGRDNYTGFALSSSSSGFRLGNVQKWWEKGLQANMREITSAQDLVDSLKNAGDQLVVLDFFSPGCGGCRALHPKLCQLAATNPDVLFLQVNYEEHKSMCYSLNVHVLPFFRFYRGSQGKLCSFSCTNATIKKFKDALSKHSPDRSSLGPTKGLEEKELMALAANKDLAFTYTPNLVSEAFVPAEPHGEPLFKVSIEEQQEKAFASSR